MEKNRLKIVYNQQTKHIAFFLVNEQREWTRLSTYSSLSHISLADGDIKEKVAEIIRQIDSSYNQGKRGVDLCYEGPSEVADAIHRHIEENYAERKIVFEKRSMKIGVAGKLHVGKTTLIEALAKRMDDRLEKSSDGDIAVYRGSPSQVEWYEMPGIDLGYQSVLKTQKAVQSISDLSVLLYCLGSNRIEPFEKEMIEQLKENCPHISVISVLTNSIEEDTSSSAASLGNVLGVKVIPVLAKERKVRSGITPAFGVDILLCAIFGEQ